ncbi:hypothetical protein AYK25_04115 [Thermoplasmatales archaeon SM1-50]|nr:MAG: hypothetical protein AYK25_04115 [Thermoplasmatales archaeon SM1-50]
MILYKWKEEIHLIKKTIIVSTLIFAVLMALPPSNGLIANSLLLSQSCSGVIRYVGGVGPNNFTTIQDAITNSTDGDTVFVYAHSSPYFENVVVNKSINLIGENQTTTVIDGQGDGDVILVMVDDVTISTFTIQHSGDTPKVDAGIECRSNAIVIQGNVVLQNGLYGVGILLNGSSNVLVHANYITENGNEGIFLQKSTNVTILENVMTHNGHCAVVISQSSYNTVIQNMMQNNYAGVSLWPGATDNEITHNSIINQTYSGLGIWPSANNNSIYNNLFIQNALYGCIITKARGNIISSNNIQGSNEGINLNMANWTLIKNNNFIDNNKNVVFENSSFNRWKRNYWDDHHGLGPKIIWGQIRVPWNKAVVIRWINLDWFPVVKPYDIPSLGGDCS